VRSIAWSTVKTRPYRAIHYSKTELRLKRAATYHVSAFTLSYSTAY